MPSTARAFAPQAHSLLVSLSLRISSAPGSTFNASEIFPMIAVEWNGPVDITIYPNPASGLLTVSGISDGPLTVILTDALGRRTLQHSLTSQARTIDLGDVANGAYQVTVSSTGGEVLKTTVIVQH